MTQRSRDTAPAAPRLSILDAVQWAVHNWRWIVGLALIGGVLFVGWALLRPPLYEADASFLPQEAAGAPSGLGGGGVLDLRNVLMGVGTNAAYYADVVRSRAVLGQVATASYHHTTEEGERREETLGEIWELDPRDGPLEQAVTEMLSDMIEVEVAGSGVVTVTVMSAEPDLAEQILTRLLEAVDRWNREYRQTSATFQRDFVKDRVEQAQEELRSAEEALKRWLEQNRDYQSPQKLFEYERLNRQVNLKQQLYTSLAQSYEQERMRAVRNTPAIAVLDAPEAELEPRSRRIPFLGVAGLIMGGALGVLLALFADWRASWSVRAASTDREPQREPLTV